MNAQGSASLEHLLLFGAQLAVLGLLAGACAGLWDLGRLRLDVEQARSFSRALAAEAEAMVSTGGFASREWTVFPSDRWRLVWEGDGQFRVFVHVGALSKTVSVHLENSHAPFSLEVSRRTRLVSTVGAGSWSLVALDD